MWNVSDFLLAFITMICIADINTIWVDLENIILSKVSQKKLKTIRFTHVWDIKLKLIDIDNSMVVTRGKGVEE